MDALPEALRGVRMTGAIFFDVEFTAPWKFTVPPLRDVADVLSPGTERLLSFHLVTDGEALAEVANAPDVRLVPGDVVMLPHDRALTVSNGSPAKLIDARSAQAKLRKFGVPPAKYRKRAVPGERPSEGPTIS
jgi:cupin